MTKSLGNKKEPIKSKLHPRNLHNNGYDFSRLTSVLPSLKAFIIENSYNQQPTINFSDTNAVKALNLALLMQYYKIQHWDIPPTYLCPPIPGRVDYIHYLADLLKSSTPFSHDKSKQKETVTVLDIGTGASCIYPILGAQAYNWHFVATDIDPISIDVANANIKANKGLSRKITCRLQPHRQNIFKGIIQENEFYHLTICNPPFHKSLSEANKGSVRKWNNLNKSKSKFDNDLGKKDKSKNKAQGVNLNFGGQKAELWCEGGEVAFINTMIEESKQFKQQVRWFTCLVSKKDHISLIKLSLKKANVRDIKVVDMAQGQKISRFVAWSFM